MLKAIKPLTHALALVGLLSLGFSQAALAAPQAKAPSNRCQQANHGMPVHKIANLKACQSPGAINLTSSTHHTSASWGLPSHKLAAQPAHHPVSHVEPGNLPQTPATQNWSIPAHQIANHQLKPAPTQVSRQPANWQGRRLASR